MPPRAERSRLTPLQQEVLRVLATVDPPWVLTGGAALAGVHLGHRVTQDLDLFWYGRDELERIPVEVVRLLERGGLRVATIQAAPGFVRLAVTADSGDRVIVDLVAEPVERIDDPERTSDGYLVDGAHEILVNKLCALVSRSEPRDLEDVRALVAAGADLERGLDDAPRKEAGFSRLTLAWALRQLPLAEAERLGFDRRALEAFRDELLDRLTSRDDGAKV